MKERAQNSLTEGVQSPSDGIELARPGSLGFFDALRRMQLVKLLIGTAAVAAPTAASAASALELKIIKIETGDIEADKQGSKLFIKFTCTGKGEMLIVIDAANKETNPAIAEIIKGLKDGKVKVSVKGELKDAGKPEEKVEATVCFAGGLCFPLKPEKKEEPKKEEPKKEPKTRVVVVERQGSLSAGAPYTLDPRVTLPPIMTRGTEGAELAFAGQPDTYTVDTPDSHEKFVVPGQPPAWEASTGNPLKLELTGNADGTSRVTLMVHFIMPTEKEADFGTAIRRPLTAQVTVRGMKGNIAPRMATAGRFVEKIKKVRADGTQEVGRWSETAVTTIPLRPGMQKVEISPVNDVHTLWVSVAGSRYAVAPEVALANERRAEEDATAPGKVSLNFELVHNKDDHPQTGLEFVQRGGAPMVLRQQKEADSTKPGEETNGNGFVVRLARLRDDTQARVRLVRDGNKGRTEYDCGVAPVEQDVLADCVRVLPPARSTDVRGPAQLLVDVTLDENGTTVTNLEVVDDAAPDRRYTAIVVNNGHSKTIYLYEAEKQFAGRPFSALRLRVPDNVSPTVPFRATARVY